MKRFLATIKNNTGKLFVSDTNYLAKMSHAHAHNMYNDDDIAIIKSLKEQESNNKVKINLDYEWFIKKSEAHAFAGVQDEDKAIIKSLNEKNYLFDKSKNSSTKC